ncbi:putative PHD type zinc finger protein with BAH domain-containing protein [Lecanora helva]
MADEHGANHERPAATGPSVQPEPQPRPPSTNNESGSTSVHSRTASKSPRQHSSPPSDVTKPAIPESQAMTASSSSSSSLPAEQQTDATGPSPYGTRSRNRTGSSRINYAEDRDIDMEYEWTSGKKPQAATPGNLQSLEGDRSSAGSNRRSSATAPNGLASNNKAPIPNPQNANLPGMSTFSAYPDSSTTTAASAPTRKRKAPGNGTTSSYISSNPAQPPATNGSRRNGASPHASRLKATNLMTFEGCQGYLKNGKLKADDGTVLAINDQVYLVCEPPGEPYYLGRIMEFLHVDNNQNAPVDSLRVNWFLRSRDIGRKVNDTRAVFASMQSDTSPITSLRGKCKILHRTDINDLDVYRKEPNAFWYEKLYDRYIHRFYEVIPTSQVINVPAKVKKVLDERWKFVVVEVGRGRELTSAIKSCKRCHGFCASNDSVDCAVCKNTYHMNCVRPPLLKKPARGFGWSCGPCSRRQEKKLEARNTPIVGEKAVEEGEEEFVDEEEDPSAAAAGNGSSSNDGEAQSSGARPPTAEQMAQAKLWPFRYLGIHCRVDDALDYDDRIYPRASSRLGPKHQATVQPWYGRPVELVKPIDVKKKFLKANSHKKDAKLTKDTTAMQDLTKNERETRPKWVMDEPPGFVARGEDYPNSDIRNTARMNFRLPQVGEMSTRGMDPPNTFPSDQRERLIDDYMTRAKLLTPSFRLQEYSTNFLDKALELLFTNNYQVERALQQLKNVNKTKDLKEPELTKEELKRFEDGVRKYGSELRLVSKHVGKTKKHGEIVRFYYMWKKTPEGKKIWGNYEGRKGKKQQKQIDSKLVDDVADDVDDSAFDNVKAAARKRGFECKFCAMRHSPQWRRAPATATGATVPIDASLKNSKDKNAHLMLALCQRCAYLWRCYAITWENPDEVAKKVNSGGGRAWKRRIDEELLAELTNASVASSIGVSTTAAVVAASVGVDVPSNMTVQPGHDMPKKKQKLASDVPASVHPQQTAPIEAPKKKIVEKPPEPPLIPEQPKIRILPCAICYEFIVGEEATDEYLCCNRCRLTVHRSCYGVTEGRTKDKWICDMCSNDTTHQVSTYYDCVLCSVREYPDKELMEAPKSHHKKKNDREKEKERLERELLVNATENYYRTQREKGRPEQPRQPLKRTTNNNWVHVVCALFHYEIKFEDPKTLDYAEGLGAIPLARYRLKCKLCKRVEGACVSCSQCQATVHVACAQQHGYQLGLDINPVKGSRASAVNIVDIDGDKGTATTVVYCKEHTKHAYNREEKKGIHSLAEMYADPDRPGSTLNALQAYARSHKQADTSQTGTVRKAIMLDAATSTATQPVSAGGNHRGSISSVASGAVSNSVATSTARGFRMSPGVPMVRSDELDQDGDRVLHLEHAIPKGPSSKRCLKCGGTVSPRWHPAITTTAAAVEKDGGRSSPQATGALVNGYSCNQNPGEHEPSKAPTVSSPRVTANGESHGSNSDQEASLSTTRLTNGETVRPGLEPSDPLDGPPKYYCNKCFQKKRREHTPPRMPTPPPDPILPVAAEDTVIDNPTDSRVSNEPEPEASSPPAPLAWPSQVAQASAQDAYPNKASQTMTPSPSVPAAAPPHVPHLTSERALNGVSPRSPPIVPQPAPQHYAPSPQQAPPRSHHHPAPYAPAPPQMHRDHRGVMHRGMPPQYHVPPVINGVPTESGSFQYRRDSSGNLCQVPYFPPSLRSQPPPPGSTLRSPPAHERPSHGPHGPPEAAENPFVVPTAASPPRQSYGSMYGSPPGSHERPETPPGAFLRESRWPGDGPLINGASASPSLRNLLQ